MPRSRRAAYREPLKRFDARMGPPFRALLADRHLAAELEAPGRLAPS